MAQAVYEDQPDEQSEQSDKRIFIDADEAPLKFHIQEDISSEVKEILVEHIEENDGKVVKGIPGVGYVLIDPRSAKGKTLSNKWSAPDHPDRHIVCYTFVMASVTKGALVDLPRIASAVPIFVDEKGRPITIYVDKHIGDARVRALRFKISIYGGIPVESPRQARVIISDDTKDTFRKIRNSYEDRPKRYVEPLIWFKTCMQTKVYKHPVILQPNPVKQPGRKPGSARNDFTPQEDHHLIEYIAEMLPHKNAGRSGNKLYKDLCENPRRYPWATTHSWHSWRNRYVKDQQRFNNAVARLVRDRKPANKENLFQPARKRNASITPFDELDESEGMDLEYESPPRKKRARDDEEDEEEAVAKNKKAKVQESDDEDEDMPAKARMLKALGAGQAPKSQQKASTSGTAGRRSGGAGATSGSGRGSGHTLSLAPSSTLRGSGASSPLKPDAAAISKGSKKGKEKEVVPIESDHEDEEVNAGMVAELRQPSPEVPQQPQASAPAPVRPPVRRKARAQSRDASPAVLPEPPARRTRAASRQPSQQPANTPVGKKASALPQKPPARMKPASRAQKPPSAGPSRASARLASVEPLVKVELASQKPRRGRTPTTAKAGGSRQRMVEVLVPRLSEVKERPEPTQQKPRVSDAEEQEVNDVLGDLEEESEVVAADEEEEEEEEGAEENQLGEDNDESTGMDISWAPGTETQDWVAGYDE